MKAFDHKSGSTLRVKGAEIYFEEHGNQTDPVLVFLHGALGSIEDLNGIVSELPEGKFRIVGIDNRGHGRSTLGSEPLSYGLLTEEVESVLKHLNIEKVTVVGFSNGGTIGYRLAAFSELEIERLITIGSPWASQHIEHLREPFSALTSEMWQQQSPSDYLKFKKLSPEQDFDKVFRQALNMALDTGPESRPNQDVEKIKCPVLALRGENDPIVSHANIEELATLNQNTKAVSIPNAGHEVFLDHLPLLMQNIRGFLGILPIVILRTQRGSSSADDLEVVVRENTLEYLRTSDAPSIRVSAYLDRDWPQVEKTYAELSLSGDCEFESLIKYIIPGSRTRKNIVLPGPMKKDEQLVVEVVRKRKLPLPA